MKITFTWCSLPLGAAEETTKGSMWSMTALWRGPNGTIIDSRTTRMSLSRNDRNTITSVTKKRLPCWASRLQNGMSAWHRPAQQIRFITSWGPENHDLNGCYVYVLNERETILNKLAELGAHTVDSREEASYIICPQTTDAGCRNQLAMCLNGGALMSEAYLLKGVGLVLAFQRIMRTPRWIFMSNKFMNDWGGFSKVIYKSVQLQPTPRLWKILSLDAMLAGNPARMNNVLLVLKPVRSINLRSNGMLGRSTTAPGSWSSLRTWAIQMLLGPLDSIICFV